MALTFKLFIDPALTTPLAAPLSFFVEAGSAGHCDAVVYLGTPVPGRILQTEINPGVDDILVSVTGSGAVAANQIKLATSSAGLDAATGGTDLNLGPILSATTPVHIRVTEDADTVGEVVLSITTSALAEYLNV